jgi:hypothetical protein
VTKTKTFSKPFVPHKDRDRKPFQREWKGKEKLDDHARHELMRKKLCFTCKDPWVPIHRCMGKGEIHYIEVEVDIDDEKHDSESTSLEEDPSHAEDHPPRTPLTPLGAQTLVEPHPREKVKIRAPTKGGFIATLPGIPMYYTLGIKGIIHGHQEISLIDDWETHNIIDATLV